MRKISYNWNMELIAKLWKNFKLQPEIWFFYGFLLTFTLTIRKVLWFFPLRGEFNEYSGAYLYLSDIFLGLIIIAWIIIILYNKIDILSMLYDVPPQKQKDCSTWNNSLLRGKRETLIYILLPLVLVAWSFISLIWAENEIVTIFRSVKMLEFYLLYIFVLIRFFCWNTKNNVPRGTLLKKIFGLVMIIGLFQAIIGIGQFILQHSIGLFWLKESLISSNISGVAKVIFNGEVFIRAYGLFPHPNILGGFLLFSILISLFYYKMFHSGGNVPPQKQENCSTPEAKGLFHVEQSFAPGQAWNMLYGKYGTIIFKLILGVQLLVLILTFSKSAIIGLFLGLIYFAYVSSRKECSTWNIPRDKRGTFFSYLRKKKRLILATSLIIVFAFIVAKPDLHSFFTKSLNDRWVYINVSRGTIWDNPILGIGSGQFVINMENMLIIKENWMLEPVHNVFLLVWSELGIIGFFILILFIGFILKGMFHVEHSTEQVRNMPELAKTFGAIFVGLLFVMFFDHYLWDIQQGSFLLWMTMGFLVGAGECKDSV